MREDYLRRTGERNKNWPTSENTLESWWLWPVCMTYAVWSDTRICNLFLKQILLFCIPYLKTSNKTLTFSVKVALDEKKLLICMPISKEFSFIFFNQFKKGKCLPTLVSRERERLVAVFRKGGLFFFLTVSFYQFVPVPISKKTAQMTTRSTGSQKSFMLESSSEGL